MGRSTRRARFVLVLSALVAGALLPGSVGAAGANDPGGADRVKVIVTLDAKPTRAAERTIEKHGGKVRARLTLVNGISALLSRGEMKKLAREPGIRRVELDPTLTAIEPVVEAAALTGDPEYDNAWGVSRIGAKVAHDAGIRGAGVRVAIIDTGIDYIHDDPDDTPYVVDPEFLGNYKGGYDFANNDADPYDDNGHGTHVAGILAAEKNGYLVVGVAPAVDLYAVKILNANGEGDVSALILALQWALDNNIDVVNMSLGTHEVSAALATAVANAGSQGLLMAAASGNVNPLDWQELFYGCPVTYPAAYPEVLSTTFTNPNDALTGYSCTGPEVDFAAPGDMIYSTVPIGTCMFCKPWGYDALSGTSMASPHLAGTIALLLSAGIADTGSPGLFDDVRARLCATADTAFGVNSTPIAKTDPRYPLYFGCGVVNAGNAVTGLVPPVNHPPVANDDTATTPEDTAVSIAILANDTDQDGNALHVTSVGAPGHGTAVLNPAGTAILYTPAANYSGADSFGYSISDGAGGADSAVVSVTVTPVDDPPTAEARTASTTSPNPVTITLRGTDIDTCDLSFQVVDLPNNGGVGSLAGQACTAGSPNADTATVVYTPTAGYSGSDSFTYRVLDATGASTAVTVSITINASQPPPPPNPIHIGDLDGVGTAQGKTWTAKVTIHVHKANETAAAGAVVTGTWSNGASGTSSCTTSNAGTCSVQVTKLASTVASAKFTVTGVALANSTYTPASNHDPDPDSDGTMIVVARPS
jgi:subtilisin